MANENPRSTAGVSLANLTKYYGDICAVKNVSLDIHPSEFLTLLGPSGSGKTTTLMMVAGFVEPSRGDVFISGKGVTDHPPHKRELGIVFQNYALFPHLSVGGNVGFPLRMRGVSRSLIEQKVEEALDLVQLSGFGGRRPRELSGGQQQRVALARAIVFDPPVLLMDEPLGALDRLLREQMQTELKRLQRALSKTVIYVTHDQEEALSLSDRIAVMNAGCIEQIGTPSEVYEHPQTEFVARFLGESNIFDGTVAGPPDDRGIPVIVGGRVLRAHAGGASHAVGTTVRIVVRPERVRVNVLRGKTPGAGEALLGTVEEITYQGRFIKLRVAVEGLGSVATLRLATAEAVREHAEVVVEWEPVAARVVQATV